MKAALLPVSVLSLLACGGGEEPGEDASAGPPVELPDSVGEGKPSPRIGLTAGQGPDDVVHWVWFDDFRLLRLAAAER